MFKASIPQLNFIDKLMFFNFTEEDNDEITDLCYVEMNRNRYV